MLRLGSYTGGTVMTKASRYALLLVLAAGQTAAPAIGQTARLPIADGVWVKTDTSCGTATNVFVHAANRFGSVYFYGPKQGMGPANETEAVSRIGRGTNGFTVVNEGPIEVAPRPNGQAVVRAFSPSQGVTWSETVRLCPSATLSEKMRTAIARLGLTPSGLRKP